MAGRFDDFGGASDDFGGAFDDFGTLCVPFRTIFFTASLPFLGMSGSCIGARPQVADDASFCFARDCARDAERRNDFPAATIESFARRRIRAKQSGSFDSPCHHAAPAERERSSFHLLPRLLVSRKSCPRLKTKSVTQTSMRPNSWRPCSPRALLTLGSPLSTPRSPPLACSAPSHPRSRCVE